MPLLSEGVGRVRKHNRKEAIQRLREIAESQHGFFTAQQAREAGFSAQAQSHNVKIENWERVHRGIYRLAFYPASERPDLMVWYLWTHNRSGNPEGVYSHETALSLHNLSDLMPAKLHITVPPTFHRAVIPEGLVLHHGILTEDETEEIHGVSVTRPMRTFIDLLEAETVSNDVLRQALAQALRQGLITKSDLLTAKSLLTDRTTLEKLYVMLVEVML